MGKKPGISRREFLKKSGTVVATAILVTGAGIFPGCDEEEIYADLILKNGMVFIDGQYKKYDVALSKGEITEIAETIIPKNGQDIEEIDCTDCYISPGWVDLHCHIGEIGLEIGRLGPKLGVTALVDAGTYGPQTFNKFLDKFYSESKIPLYLFLNLRKDGLTMANMLSKNGPGVEDIEGAEALIKKYPDIIKGFKVRIDSSNVLKDNPMFLAQVTADLADDLNVPVVYHLGNPDPTIEDFLNISKSGDIITHCFRGKNNCIIDSYGNIKPGVMDAISEGINFDTGHGVASFVFKTARNAFEQGFNDFTISSDLWLVPSAALAFTFANVASKFLALGLSIEDVTLKSSTRPREILNLESKIETGNQIDLTIFSIKDGNCYYVDSAGALIKTENRIMPEYTIIDGQVIRAGGIDRTLFSYL